MDNSNVSDQMLAAVYYGPRDIRLEQRDIPKIGANEAFKMAGKGKCIKVVLEP